MSTVEQPSEARAQRADALRNRKKVLEAAHDAFAERGTSTSLEEIARRAGVGIGTLYRHFPTRQELLEAVYVDEVEGLCDSVADLAPLEPWDAFAQFMHRLVAYIATKHALAAELMDYLDRDAPVFKTCRTALLAAAEPLLERAQRAKAIRSDTDLSEVIHMAGGIAKIQGLSPEQVDHILGIALDGLRYRASG
jgi:AcrR family transcriptional regulator